MMDQTQETANEQTTPLRRRHSFRWRDGLYRLDLSTWQFWGGARLFKLPGEPTTFRMTPDDGLFLRYGAGAGFAFSAETEAPVLACQAFLEQAGYQVWTIPQAIDTVRADVDPALAEQLMDRLIYFYFLIKY